MMYSKKSVKRILLAALIAIWMVVWATAVCAKVIDRVIARVNKDIVTLSELEERTQIELNRLKVMGIEPLPDISETRADVLDRIIEEKLVVDHGKKMGYEVDEESVLKALDEIKVANHVSDEELEMMLKAEGRSIEEYKDNIRNQILMGKVVNYEIKSRVLVSEKEIRSYYDRHQKDFWQPVRIHARHILFIMDDGLTPQDRQMKESKARFVLEKLKSGESFEELAKAYSEDVSAGSGGDLGVLEHGKLLPEFEKAALSLKAGQVSDIVRTAYGLHIIKVDKIEPGRTRPLDEVKDEIRNILYAKNQKKLYQKFLENLKKEAYVEKLIRDSGQAPKQHIVASVPPRKKESRQKIESKRPVAEILPPLTIGKQAKPKIGARNSHDGGLKTLEEKLRYFKTLRKADIITEAEYQKRKKELLDHL